MYARIFTAQRRVAWLAMCVAAGFLACTPGAWAADATVLDTDPNVDGLGFGRTDAFVFGGAYSQNDAATFNGNDVLAQTQAGFGGGTGAGFSVPVSNGENGITQSLDGGANEVVNPDLNNPTPANAVFTTIGNSGGKLANGNVVRYSAWVRVNPNNPLTVAPQIEPVFKFEFWKEALSTNQDTGGGQAQPFFGDKIYDTDQHASEGIWIDLNNDGAAIDGGAAGSGRLRTVTTSAWTLIEAVHTVNDANWLGIGDDPYTVAHVEEVRGVMFWGDFAGTNFGADGADGGTLFFDNIKMEVFKDVASVTPNVNPNPDLRPGDFDDDGDVDGVDLGLWRGAYGLTAVGDADNDNDSDGNDFLIWQRNLGPASAVSAVPEPGTIALAIAGLAVVAGARRRGTA